MSFISISDVHVKNLNDPIYQDLLSFLDFAKEKRVKTVFLLGDIFDLMIGSHQKYEILFCKYFDKLKNLLDSEIEVIFVEGNHDFHLAEIYSKYGVTYIQKKVIKNYKEKIFHFGHGDELQIKNLNYKIYKRTVNNPLMNFVANKVVPFDLINSVGVSLSKRSRARNQKRYREENDLEVKRLFRESVDQRFKKALYDYVICGHSHVRDDYQSPAGFRYLNNGYYKLTREFIYYNGKDFSFIKAPSHG